MPLLRYILFTTSLMLPCLCFAQVYKWVDEYGRTHFGDRPNKALEQQVVEINQNTSKWTPFNIHIETRNLVLSDEETRLIENGVNHVYEFYDQVLHFNIYKTVPVDILVLKNKTEYVAYLNENDLGMYKNSLGLYLGNKNQIIVYLNNDKESTFRTIRHEVSHAIIDTMVPFASAWLNEGLAEQMETIAKDEMGLYVSPHLANQNAVNKALNDGNLLSIEAFLKLSSPKWRHSLISGSNTHLQSQAGQFVFFLLSTPTKRNFIVRLLNDFKHGERKIAYYLVDDHYIGGVKAMDASWKIWVKNQSNEVVEFF